MRPLLYTLLFQTLAAHFFAVLVPDVDNPSPLKSKIDAICLDHLLCERHPYTHTHPHTPTHTHPHTHTHTLSLSPFFAVPIEVGLCVMSKNQPRNYQDRSSKGHHTKETKLCGQKRASEQMRFVCLINIIPSEKERKGPCDFCAKHQSKCVCVCVITWSNEGVYHSMPAFSRASPSMPSSSLSSAPTRPFSRSME